MRFFTWGSWSGTGSDDSLPEKFVPHLHAIAAKLPGPLMQLFHEYSLHDGRIVEFFKEPEANTLLMVINGWNSFNGEYKVVYRLLFNGVESMEFRSQDGQAVDPLALDDLGYYEVDIDNENLIRLDCLFWGGTELSISFRDIEVQADAHDW